MRDPDFWATPAIENRAAIPDEQIDMDLIKLRVDAGEEYLRVNYGDDFWDRIDIGKIQIHCDLNCMVAQLRGNYFKARIAKDPDRAKRYGFLYDSSRPVYGKALGQEWRRRGYAAQAG